jgi:hypothetical protein
MNKSFLNAPEDIVDEALEGLIASSPNLNILDGGRHVSSWQPGSHVLLPAQCSLYCRQVPARQRAAALPLSYHRITLFLAPYGCLQIRVVVDSEFSPSQGKVAVISGGGSGHEPAMAGYVGQGEEHEIAGGGGGGGAIGSVENF